jgi:hypothetical protein
MNKSGIDLHAIRSALRIVTVKLQIETSSDELFCKIFMLYCSCQAATILTSSSIQSIA